MFDKPDDKTDLQSAEEIRDKLDDVAKLMTAAWKRGLDVGYGGIPRSDRGVYKVAGFVVNRRILQRD